MNTNQKPDMLPTPTLEENFNNMFSIVDTVSNAVDSLLIPQLESDLFTNTSKALSQFASSCDVLLKDIDFNTLRDTLNQLVGYLENLSLPSCDFSSLSNEIDISEDCVTISDNAVDNLTDFFVKNEKQSPQKISHCMSISEFIGIVLAILGLIIPIYQNHHYRQLDEAEAQRIQQIETEFQETIIYLLNQQLEEEQKQTTEQKRQADYSEKIYQLTNENIHKKEYHSVSEENDFVPKEIHSVSE